MRLLFVDESGDTKALARDDASNQPVLVLLGLSVKAEQIEPVTRRWVELKRRFFPDLCSKQCKTWDWLTREIKGSALRSRIRDTRHRKHRAAIGFLDRTLDLCDQYELAASACVWIKSPGDPFDGRAVYTSSIQWLCARFQACLDASDSLGTVIADHRNPGPDSIVAHSVFTQKFKHGGDQYPRIIEVPVFGHSANHAGIQIADVLASALLSPACCRHFLMGRLDNIHVTSTPSIMVDRFRPRLEALFARFCPNLPATKSLVVDDPVGRRGSASLFVGEPQRRVSECEIVTTVSTAKTCDKPSV